MRRIATLLGTLATVGALALMAPAQASAATGTLNINGQDYVNPDKSCYKDDNPWRLYIHVSNHTDTTAWVYEGADCSSGYLGYLMPNNQASFYRGSSVRLGDY